MWTVGFETVIERQRNYSKVVHAHVRRGVCACTVRARRVTKMGLDMESRHTKRDNQIMIKTKQMVT